MGFEMKNNLDKQLFLREQENQALRNISHAMVSKNVSNSENILQMILTKSVEISNADAGFIILKNPDSPSNEKQFQQVCKVTLSQQLDIKNNFFDLKESNLFNSVVNQNCPKNWYEEGTQSIQKIENHLLSKNISDFKYNSNTYKIKSYCAYPIRKPGAEVEGVIVLINKKTTHSQILKNLIDVDNNVLHFSEYDINLLESMANQAGISLEHTHLIHELKFIFKSFTAACVTAIESRDPSTKGHSERVAQLTVALAEAVNQTHSGTYSAAHFTKEEIEEIRYASLLHDFGKIGVREPVLQKEKKLYPFQVDQIKNRFELLKEKLYVHTLENYIQKLIQQNKIPTESDLKKHKNKLQEVQNELDHLFQIILEMNEPSLENMETLEKITKIAATKITLGELSLPILTKQEIDILSIPRGSLSRQERLEIESHVTHSYNFLVQIPWTKEFKNLPEIVYGHHEREDGSGYPRKLISQNIPIQAKMMAITDVFDALVSRDRPYKKAVPMLQALNILDHDVQKGKLDKELFRIFTSYNIGKLIIDVEEKRAS